MKTPLLFCFLLLGGSALFAQRIENIRFIYVGEEDKPVGTVLIGIGKYQPPTDRGYVDKYFGTCHLTTPRTFDTLRSFIQHSKLLVRAIPKISDTTTKWILGGYSFLQIVGSDGSVAYLCSRDRIAFFRELRAILRTENLDQKIVANF